MRIGLTYTGSPEKHENYVRWLELGRREDDARFEVLKLGYPARDLAEMQGLDGLVLSGGIDIYPPLYEAAEGYPHQPQHWEEERDLFERDTLRYALDKGIPVLGICRGLQLINTTLGGSLVQDLGEAGNTVHKNEGLVDKRHELRMDRDSLLFGMTRAEHGEVNSAHHQAIDRLGEGLRVNCRAGDGTIEGIEWQEPAGRPWLMAVQWHPERMSRDAMADEGFYVRLREHFLAAVRQMIR